MTHWRTEGVRNFRILEGDAMAVLPTLDAESVHCVVTSPPYWGLEERRAVGIERWAKQEHDRGNRYGMRGVEDALMEQAVIAGMRRNRR